MGYVPAKTLQMVVVVAPLLQVCVYGFDPPAIVIVAHPFAKLQLAGVTDDVIVNEVG
jgi:hypothetical protein